MLDLELSMYIFDASRTITVFYIHLVFWILYSIWYRWGMALLYFDRVTTLLLRKTTWFVCGIAFINGQYSLLFAFLKGSEEGWK